MKTIQPQNWKTFHHGFKKDTKPHNQKLPGSDNLPCIHKIRNSCSGCDDDHELEQGFHLQLGMHGGHGEAEVTDSDS
jgi:hypothetical protein